MWLFLSCTNSTWSPGRRAHQSARLRSLSRCNQKQLVPQETCFVGWKVHQHPRFGHNWSRRHLRVMKGRITRWTWGNGRYTICRRSYWMLHDGWYVTNNGLFVTSSLRSTRSMATCRLCRHWWECHKSWQQRMFLYYVMWHNRLFHALRWISCSS